MLCHHKEGFTFTKEVTSELALNRSWPALTWALRECHPCCTFSVWEHLYVRGRTLPCLLGFWTQTNFFLKDDLIYLRGKCLGQLRSTKGGFERPSRESRAFGLEILFPTPAAACGGDCTAGKLFAAPPAPLISLFCQV